MSHDANGIPLEFGATGTSPLGYRPPAPEPKPRKVPHCAIRAKERYGIDLSWEDVEAISRRCLAGEGRIGGNPDGAQFHMIIFGDRVLWVVYRPPALTNSKFGVVVTIMPPKVAETAVKRDRRHQARRTGDYERRKRGWA